MVTEYDGARVNIFDKQGRKLQTIQHDDLLKPCGIAADQDGNIYASTCSYAPSIIAKFDKDGHTLKVVKSQGYWLNLLRVINGMLYVCCGGSSTVLVYDCNTLQPSRSFGKRGRGKEEFETPYDVLSVNGELYVSDRDNYRIQVFDQEGLNFVRSFMVKNTLQRLCKPRGICAGPDGLLYVACYSPSCVLVFTLRGEFVASLGEVSDPRGIAVDSDGFVYVCCSNVVLAF